VIGIAVDEVLAVGPAEVETGHAEADTAGVAGADAIGLCRIGGARHLGLRLDRMAGRVME
jgi:hypothetical protein